MEKTATLDFCQHLFDANHFNDKHMRTLVVAIALSATFSCLAANAKSPGKSDTSNQKICTLVGETLRRISNMRPHSYFDPLYVDSIEAGGRESIFQNVDLDGDGKPDDVMQGCGSPSDGSCTLYVTLSNGGGYEVTEEPFGVIRFRSKYYIIVGDTYPQKNTNRRLYSLTGQGAELVCKSF